MVPAAPSGGSPPARGSPPPPQSWLWEGVEHIMYKWHTSTAGSVLVRCSRPRGPVAATTISSAHCNPFQGRQLSCVGRRQQAVSLGTHELEDGTQMSPDTFGTLRIEGETGQRL
jgi:hypothetical protein